MQRSENKVAGGRGGERQLDGFQVAHFADQNDVGVFAQGASQRRRKRARVHSDFAVVHQTILAAMHKLDRVFDGNDVILPCMLA